MVQSRSCRHKLAGRLNHLETQNSGKLPSQPLNPIDFVNAVTLRSGTRTVQPEDAEKNKDPKGLILEKEITDSSQTDELPKENSKTPVSTYVPPFPFPRRFSNSKQDKEILDIFRKIHVNIPLTDAIKQVPKYARILKDLCTNKQRLTGNEVMKVGENASAILQKKLPLKCKDPGSFDILIVIGNTKFNKAMLDLGASVNVMPVNQLISSGFFVLEMTDGSTDTSLQLLLGRPFMSMTRTKIEVHDGSLTMEFDGEAPKLELKPLPGHLKYMYLGDNEELPVIVSNALNELQEQRLLRVLREYKTAIGWTIADIKGIIPSTCMHKIRLEDEAKPTREAQRRLNPSMMEVVKKEILKLLDVGVFYPISDRKWVIPVQVVPKKSGVTVVQNDNNELVPTRYNQIAITPEDQEKTTFTFLVYGDSFDLCLDNLTLILKRCVETNIVLNWEKCHFMVTHDIVLGHIISSKGLEVDKSKIDLIRSLTPPTTVREIRAFLGQAGFYRRFIKDFSNFAAPLCRLLQKDVVFNFDEKCLE
ncbi:uncharacterized protein LOC113290743 [Papaver somniferum]|uniref:uncharacterized protein LOC113290743 n=1 Tax=Papaver somniferum TaxID=3469 RepID=UPI000E70218E|nr:uncharacterized protein LOC113290743 [Papaver somniferum]